MNLPPLERTLKLRAAMLELLKAVSDHPDSMFPGAPLHDAFIKASDALREFDPPPSTLLRAVEGSIDIP